MRAALYGWLTRCCDRCQPEPDPSAAMQGAPAVALTAGGGGGGELNFLLDPRAKVKLMQLAARGVLVRTAA